MTHRKQKHMDESWVVKANRERDELERIKSRESIEALREEFSVPPAAYELTDEQISELPILDIVSVVKELENVLDTELTP